jgi:hypothetical protein
VSEYWTGVKPTIDAEFQGGMYMIDFRVMWREMMLVRWIDDNARYYWRPGRNVYHDESSWRMAMQATGHLFTRLRYAMNRGGMLPQYDGRAVIVHRIRRGAKMFPERMGAYNPALPLEDEVFRIYRDVVRRDEDSWMDPRANRQRQIANRRAMRRMQLRRMGLATVR